MKKLVIIGLSGALAMGGLMASAATYAHGRFYGGVVIGGPVWVPPPVYYPPPVYIERAPPVYVEQPRQDYWYYCPESKTYYPYVQSCPSPWMKVVPNMPGAPGTAPQ